MRFQCARPSWMALSVMLVLSPVAPGQDDDEAEHEQLRVIKRVFETAVADNNLELLRPYLDEGFSVVTYTDSDFTDFEIFKQRWEESRKRLLAGGTYDVELLPERSTLLGDIALARGNSKNVLVSGSGDRYEFSSNWTAVLRKVDGEWKILRVHSSLDPFGNPMIMSGFRKTATKLGVGVGAGALLVGLILGWLSKSWISRRGAPESAEPNSQSE